MALGASAWHTSAGYRSAELRIPAGGRAGFTLLAPEATGVTFTNWLAQDRHLTNQIYLNGSGVACGDVDGDGWCDLYFCGLDGPNRLYRNLGNWRFQDITDPAGVSCASLDATAAAFADIDGDGDLDLLMNTVGQGTRLFVNDGQGRFTEPPASAGLNAQRAGMSMALADMDGDGDLDLYVANYRAVTIRDQPNTRFTFSIVEGQPVVKAIDGRPLTDFDLTNRFTFRVSLGETGGRFQHEENGEPDALFRNDGKGNFTPVSWTDGSFLDEEGKALTQPPFDWGLSVMFRDLNGDGAPDLYVCNDFNSPDRIWMNDSSPREITGSDLTGQETPGSISRGKGRFRAIARLAVRQICLSSMGVDVADINRDGFDDIFVLDMLSREHQRRSMQRLELRPETPPFGSVEYRQQSSRNTLLLNRGDGTYAEIAQLAGLEASEWSWTPTFLDVDLDGYEDLLVSNGFERDGMNVDVLKRIEAAKKAGALSSLEQLRLRRLFPRLDTPNVAFRNLGNLTFEEVGQAWGFHHRAVSQGMALADLDNDGDLDVVINNSNGAAMLYRNETSAPRLAVRLRGLPPNTRGIGARIKVVGGPVAQSQEMICGGRYLSSDDPMRVFAAGAGTNSLTIEVTWRSGTRSVVSNARPNCIYEIAEAAASRITDHETRITNHPARAPTPWFEDVSQLLGHTHAEEPFDDFARQPLLSHRLSQLGPGVSWADLDGDGWDDLIVGSGRGGQLAAFRNDGRGGFNRLLGPPFTQIVTRDQTTVLALARPAGQTVLLAGSANYEDGLAAGSCVRQYELATKAVTDSLPGQESSTGPLALADVDGDGHLDLFVGGRVIAGRWPEPASSLLFRGGAGGRFSPDVENTRRLAKVGLVSGAVFSDLDGNGDPDLVLACEWGPLKIFRNERGQLVAWDPPVERKWENGKTGTRENDVIPLSRFPAFPLSSLTGWWTGVTTGDFDGDGRLDIVAANWGRNTRYESVRTQPLRLFYGDLDGNGTVETIEAYFDRTLKKIVPLQPLHLVASAMPLVQERIGSCEAYAKASLQEIYGDSLSPAKELQANWLESTVFFNRGDRFEARALPVEAQMAPAFAVNVGDFDGDGQEDIFLSQNFFGTPPEASRYDAGRGLWLRGDGQGGFRAVPGQESGVKIYGEQRGAALGDYDRDGRVDLVVTQNSAETKLFRNLGAAPGWRVRLAGPAGNPAGIGAVVRLVMGERMGPARELHAGSGYWSQDSAVPVLGAASMPTHVWVRWPGGKIATSTVPDNAREVTVKME